MLIKTIPFSKFSQNLKPCLDNVIKSEKPLYITLENGKEVVVLPKSDYTGLQETYYLMSSPRNAEYLLEAIKELDEGKGVKRILIEE